MDESSCLCTGGRVFKEERACKTERKAFGPTVITSWNEFNLRALTTLLSCLPSIQGYFEAGYKARRQPSSYDAIAKQTTVAFVIDGSSRMLPVGSPQGQYWCRRD